MPGERFNGRVQWLGVLGPAGAWRDRLAIAAGGDRPVPRVATLLDRPFEECERLLEHLVDAHMLERDKPGRYRFPVTSS
jgi:hypothetical protein